MRTWLAALGVLALAACGSSAPAPTATGTLVYEPVIPAVGSSTPAMDDSREALATAAVVLRSRSLIDRVNRERQLTGARALTPEAIRVRRVGDSRILEIGVHHADPAVAALQCNALMQALIESRMIASRAADDARAQALAAQLDDARRRGSAGAAKQLEHRLREVELDKMTRPVELRVLDPCR